MSRFNFPPELHLRQTLRQRVDVPLRGPAHVGLGGQRLAVALELERSPHGWRRGGCRPAHPGRECRPAAAADDGPSPTAAPIRATCCRCTVRRLRGRSRLCAMSACSSSTLVRPSASTRSRPCRICTAKGRCRLRALPDARRRTESGCRQRNIRSRAHAPSTRPARRARTGVPPRPGDPAPTAGTRATHRTMCRSRRVADQPPRPSAPQSHLCRLDEVLIRLRRRRSALALIL